MYIDVLYTYKNVVVYAHHRHSVLTLYQEYIIEGECPTAYTGLMHERV